MPEEKTRKPMIDKKNGNVVKLMVDRCAVGVMKPDSRSGSSANSCSHTRFST
jgi:hypothetical protein